MITCNLSKPEATFDQIRKTYKDLKPTDIALIATALVEAGRFAEAHHDGVDYEWTPEQYDGLTASLGREVAQIQEVLEPEKPVKKTKAAKAAAEEDVQLHIQLKPSVAAGERILGDRKELKTLFGDILSEGVEYLYSPTDIGWHWTVERVNWQTQLKEELKRRVKFQAKFLEPHVGMEVGTTTRKRKR